MKGSSALLIQLGLLPLLRLDGDFLLPPSSSPSDEGIATTQAHPTDIVTNRHPARAKKKKASRTRSLKCRQFLSIRFIQRYTPTDRLVIVRRSMSPSWAVVIRFILYFLLVSNGHFLVPSSVQGCNVTLWPRGRFQHRFGAGPCFFRLPNRVAQSSLEHYWIEVAFSSFQMGRVVNQTCPLGHLKVTEDGPFGSSTGTFCGRLSDSQTYLTRSKSLTLYAHPASETDHLNAYFDILSIEALRKRYPEIRYRDDDTAVSDDRGGGGLRRCDMVVRDCPDICRISSPLYPVSSVPRNVTCRYRIHLQRSDWQVVIGGQPGDRYDLSFHPDCQADHLTVYEKMSSSPDGGGGGGYQQVAKFCGRGNIPKIIAQGGEMLVVMRTSAAGSFHQGFRLSVSHQRKKRWPNHNIISPCHHSINGETAPSQGSISSPRHWFPRNIDCTWSLASGRIWLEIQSRSKTPSNNNNSIDTLSTTKNHLHHHHHHHYYGRTHASNNGTHPVCAHRLEVLREPEQFNICESNSTQVHTLLVRDRVLLRFVSQRGSMSGSELDFSIFYMLLPEESPVVADTQCDRIVEESNGTLQLLGDRLLLRQKQLKCRYRFQASDDYRIRIVVRRLVFDPIRQCEPSDECSDANRQFDSLVVTDRDVLRCFCQSSNNVTVVESASNRLDVQLNLKQVYDQSYKDPNIYHFQIDYAWIEDRCGNPIEDDQGGVIRWPADSSSSTWTSDAGGSNQSCTWLIELPQNDRILMKINMALGDDCERGYVSLGYQGNRSRQVEKLCSMNGEFISPFALRYLHVQLQAGQPRARFLLKWNVLFRTAPEPLLPDKDSDTMAVGNFPCPDTNWSIPESLVCDGRINCPQQSLFGYLLDEESCTRSYYQDYYPWVMVLVVSFGFSVTISLASVSSHIRKWREVKTPSRD